ncbi:hypothetical protein Ancab_019071 [Ancistrocladus abbreviatus]
MKLFSPLIRPNQVCSSPVSSPGSGISDPKKVYLHDWWIMKPHGKGIAIGGCSRRGLVGRFFHSAAITKRHDTSTLETFDGFIVLLSGFINRSRTQQNGFPSEFCSHFLIGFPYDWEDYAAQYTEGETSSRNNHTRHSEFIKLDESSETSNIGLSNDFSVSNIRDILLCIHGNQDGRLLRKHVLSNALEKLNSVLDRTPSRSEKSSVEQECRSHDGGLTAADRSRGERLQKAVSPFTMVNGNILDRTPANMKSPVENKCNHDTGLAAANIGRVEEPPKPDSLIKMVSGNSESDGTLAKAKKSRVEKKFENLDSGRAAADEGNRGLPKPALPITVMGVNSAPDWTEANIKKSIIEKYRSHVSGLAAADRGPKEVLLKPDSPCEMVGGNSRKTRFEQKCKSGDTDFAAADGSKEKLQKPVSPFAMVRENSVSNGIPTNTSKSWVIAYGSPSADQSREQLQKPFKMCNDVHLAEAGRRVCTRSMLKALNQEELNCASNVHLEKGPASEAISPDSKGRRRATETAESGCHGLPCRSSSRLQNRKRYRASKSK